MLSRRTVFVVGAGASCELGLPSGDGLKTKIAESLRIREEGHRRRFSDEAVRNAVQELTSKEDYQSRESVNDAFFEASKTISDALPFALSIDNYLDAQRDNPQIVVLGKIAIARAILAAEEASVLSRQKVLNSRLQDVGSASFPQKAIESWHLRLVQLLTAGKPASQIGSVFDDTAFIVFNYDRCVEHYLSRALMAYYRVDDASIRDAMQNLQVIHPYGQVGGLPWQTTPNKVRYGESVTGGLLDIALGVKTFTESVESGVAQAVKETMRSADTIVFMGFGFLPQNVELLTVVSQSQTSRVFFTTKGISENDVAIVEEEIAYILKKKEEGSVFPSYNYDGLLPRLEEEEAFWEGFVERQTCLDLMNNNWLRLTRR